MNDGDRREVLGDEITIVYVCCFHGPRESHIFVNCFLLFWQHLRLILMNHGGIVELKSEVGDNTTIWDKELEWEANNKRVKSWSKKSHVLD